MSKEWYLFVAAKTIPVSTDFDIKEAFQVAITLIYAMNGTAGRLRGNAEFTGDQDET